MVEPLRHRQTKGAETDMPGLPPPRHFPTLPEPDLCAWVPGRLWRPPIAEVTASREMLADLWCSSRQAQFPRKRSDSASKTEYSLHHRVRSESPDGRHSELAYHSGFHNTDVQSGVIYFLQGLPGDAS